MERIQQIGVIADTHGHLPASVATHFKSVDLIVHAGDIDHPDILKALRKWAPVIAVRGNMDRGEWARQLLPAEMMDLEGGYLYILHDLNHLDLVPESIGIKAVISGHTHRPVTIQRNGVLYLNPGSAVYPRQGADPTVALLNIGDLTWSALHVQLS